MAGCSGSLPPRIRLRVEVVGMKEGAGEALWKRMDDSDSDTGPGKGNKSHSCRSGALTPKDDGNGSELMIANP